MDWLYPYDSYSGHFHNKQLLKRISSSPSRQIRLQLWVVRSGLLVIPVTGEYKALFETAVSEKSSVQLGVGFIGPSVLVNLDDLASDDAEAEISALKQVVSGFRVV